MITTSYKTPLREEPVRSANAGMAIQVIHDAFRHDRIVRWIWPEEHSFEEAMPRFIAAFGGGAFSCGSADVLGDDRAAALWLPYGTVPDEESVMEILTTSVSPNRHSEIFGMFEQMERLHPTEPHWYLPLIGVREEFQGRGYGSVLMRHALDRCDRDGLPAYLEATSSRNVPFYENFGFRTIGIIQSGTSPELYAMLRPAQAC